MPFLKEEQGGILKLQTGIPLAAEYGFASGTLELADAMSFFSERHRCGYDLRHYRWCHGRGAALCLLKVVVVRGLGNTRRLMWVVNKGMVECDFHEVMIYPGGADGGQPIHDGYEMAEGGEASSGP